MMGTAQAALPRTAIILKWVVLMMVMVMVVTMVVVVVMMAMAIGMAIAVAGGSADGGDDWGLVVGRRRDGGGAGRRCKSRSSSMGTAYLTINS